MYDLQNTLFHQNIRENLEKSAKYSSHLLAMLNLVSCGESSALYQCTIE